MSTIRTIHCSQCGEAGHNRRTCTNLSRSDSSKTDVLKGDTIKFDAKPFPTCMICMDEVCEVKNSMTLPCGHSFHVTCGVKWLQENNSCPVCRAECGEKIKKKPILTPQVGMSLAQYRINSINLPAIVNDIQHLHITPWLSSKFATDLVSRENVDINSISPVDLKNYWDALTQESRNARMTAWMFEIMSTVAGRSMMDVLHDAYHFQEAGMGIPGDSSSWERGSNMSLGIAVIPTPDPPAADPPVEDFEEVESDSMPSHVAHAIRMLEYRNSEDEDESSMPALEEDEDESSMPELEESDDEESITIEEGEEAVARALNFHPMTIDELNVDFTTIVDIPTLDEELDAFLDDQIADMNTVELSTPETVDHMDELVSTPPPSPNRSGLQSPIGIQDQHVTRRTSERLRQRYRRRRLEEERESMGEE